MNWLIWRQHRKQILFGGITVAMYAAVLAIVGTVTAHSYHQALAAHGENYWNYFHVSGAARYLPLATIVLPLLLGIFWGAPLIAKEYEDGTNKLVWTQSVTRRKWLTAKLGWMMGFAALYGAIMSAAATWCLRTEHALWLDHFEWVHFDVHGLMPVVYAVFAVALGATIGAWSRRVMLALAITLGVFIALQGAMGLYVRAHYAEPFRTTTTETYRQPVGDGAWKLLSSTTAGVPAPLNRPVWMIGRTFGSPKGCPVSTETDKGKTCINILTSSTSYHPDSRFWRFQYIEAGIYIGLTLVLVGVTYRLVVKRDA